MFRRDYKDYVIPHSQVEERQQRAAMQIFTPYEGEALIDISAGKQLLLAAGAPCLVQMAPDGRFYIFEPGNTLTPVALNATEGVEFKVTDQRVLKGRGGAAELRSGK